MNPFAKPIQVPTEWARREHESRDSDQQETRVLPRDGRRRGQCAVRQNIGLFSPLIPCFLRYKTRMSVQVSREFDNSVIAVAKRRAARPTFFFTPWAGSFACSQLSPTERCAQQLDPSKQNSNIRCLIISHHSRNRAPAQNRRCNHDEHPLNSLNGF